MRCFTMQAVMRGMSGISELHRRNASPVHICRASALKAKPEVDTSAENETANAATKPAWRIVLVKEAGIFGSHWPCSAGPLVVRRTLPHLHRPDCDVHHARKIETIRKAGFVCGTRPTLVRR